MSYALRFGFLNSMLGLYLSCKVLENNEEQKPRLFMTIGTEDFMYKDNLRLKEKIEALDEIEKNIKRIISE